MSNTTVIGKKNRIRGLDGLRAIAALAVFAVHFNQIVRFDTHIGPIDVYKLLANGEHGVALFLILSGFLLAMPFWRALQSGAPLPGLGVYALRRMARIIPVYYVVLTVLIFHGNIWKTPGALADILLHYTFLFNYTEFSIFSINPPFWTLAVEVQFYVLLPSLFLVIRRMTVWQSLCILFAVAAGAYTIQYGLMNSVTHTIPWPFAPWLTWVQPYGAVISHSLFAHFPHFLLGVAAGKLFLYLKANEVLNSKRMRRFSESSFWLCLALIVLMLGTGLEEKIQIPNGRYGLPIVPVLLAILILSAPVSRIARRCLDFFPLRVLGLISYGFYIYHFPCLHLTDRYMTGIGIDARTHWVLFGLISLALATAVASISYLAIEKPILLQFQLVRIRGYSHT